MTQPFFFFVSQTPGAAAAGVCLFLCFVAMACASTGATAQSTSPATGKVTADAVTEIAIEHRCSGCANEFEVVLRRDGTAAKTTFGNNRRGTTDRAFVGAVPVSTFDTLARAIVSEKFFELRDEYRDPTIADSPWVKTTVATGAQRKSVVDRDGMGPAALRGLQTRIEQVVNSLSWREK